MLRCAAVVLAIDTLLFVTASFHGQENFQQVLMSSLIGKSTVAILYSVFVTGYLLLTRPTGKKADVPDDHIRDIFHILTYKQRFELLEEEVRRDSLSGLFNRRFFDENLRQELNRAKRLQHSLNLALIDIDHFKSINDQYGHQVGDEAIVALADSMQQAFRRSDILCRYGGEEFAVIMPDSSIEAAFKATQRLQTLYRKTCSERDLKCGADISFTAGIASFPSDIDTEEGLIQLADQRLYKGKNKGRNQVRIDTQILRTINTD